MKPPHFVSQKIIILHDINKNKGYFKQKCQVLEKSLLISRHPVYMVGAMSDRNKNPQVLVMACKTVLCNKLTSWKRFCVFNLQEMDFQKLLLDVGKSLSDDEVEALAFLCTDLLHKSTITVDGVRSLFSLLMDENHMSAENPQILMELLRTIQRPVVLRSLGLPVQQFSSSNFISPYRWAVRLFVCKNSKTSWCCFMVLVINKKIPIYVLSSVI